MWLSVKRKVHKTSVPFQRKSLRPTLEALEDRCLLSAGSLDPSFGIGGLVNTDVASLDDFGGPVAIAPDGKIVVGGTSRTDTATTGVVARYNSNGSLDASFGISGLVTLISDSFPFTSANTLAVQPDGRIVVAGQYSASGIAVARLTTNGQLDPTFNGSGTQVVSFGSIEDSGSSLALESDGSVVVAGATLQNGYTAFAVAKLTSAGQLDTSFNGSGEQIIDFGAGAGANAVALAPDGGVFLAGALLQPGGGFAVARLTGTGQLDTSFNGTGLQTIHFGSSDDYANSAAVQADGKLVVAGYSDQGASTGYDFAVARFSSTGQLDTSFNGTGKQTIDLGSDDFADAVAIQNDGKLVLAGQVNVGAGSDFGVVRLTDAGQLDNTFGDAGKVVTDFGNSNALANGVAIQADGAIVVSGQNNQGTSTGYDFALARYQGYDLSVVGTASNDTITIDAGTQIGTLKITVNGNIQDNVVVNGEVYVAGRGGDDIITVLAAPTGKLVLDGGDGSDTYNLTFGDIALPVTLVDSGTTADADSLNTFGAAGDNYINKTATQVTWGYPATETVSFSGIEHLTVTGGSGNNTIIDPGDMTTNIVGGPQNNNIVITSTGGGGVQIQGGAGTNTYTIDLGSLAAPVTISNTNAGASDSLVVNGAAGDNAITASGSQVTAANQTINLNAPLASATINGGSGNNQITVSGLSVPVQNLNLNGGSGDNQITVANLAVPVQSLNLNGGSGANTFALVNVGPNVAALAVTEPTGSANNQVQVQGSLPSQATLPPATPVVDLGPSVGADKAAVTVAEGATASNTGTFSDYAESVSVVASIGTVVQTGTQSGTWSWSYNTTDGPAQSQTVTITATNTDGTVSTTTFALTVSNVAPTATLSNNGPITYGQSATVSFSGQHDVSSVDTAAGFHYAYATTAGGFSGATYATAGTSATHPFTNLTAGTHTLYARVIDKDDGFTQYSTDVTVNKAALTVTADNQRKVYGAADPALTGTITGIQYGDNITATYSTTATQSSPVGSYPITATLNDPGSKLGNYAAVINGGTLTVGTLAGSVYVLNPSAQGALTLSGDSSINIPGNLIVDSSASKAITAGGNATVTAASVQVVGGVKTSGHAVVTKTGVPAATGDPLAGLPVPSTTGLTNYGPVTLDGHDARTVNPGIYSQIKVSGNASLKLNPGVYYIAGGGFTAGGNASVTMGSGPSSPVTGSGVLIYNGGSLGGSDIDYGGITLKGKGSLQLNAAFGGTYAGVLIFQARANTRALDMNGHASAGITGAIYAPAALMDLDGQSALSNPLVVWTLNLSGDVSLTQMAAGSDGIGDLAGIANTLIAGDLNVYVSDPGGYFTAEELARIQDTVSGLDTLLAPYNVTITLVSDPALANLIVDNGTTSAVGSAADGVLGCFNGANSEITILQGWNWYAGADASQIGADQYDFQTTITHELGHALGLGGASVTNSPMYETLATGTAHRVMTVPDLNIPYPPEGADPLTAAPMTARRVETGHLPARPAGFTITLALTSNPASAYGIPLFFVSGQRPVACVPPSVPALPVAPVSSTNDAETWLGLDAVWSRFGDRPTWAIPALEQTSPEEIPLILENPEIFKVEPMDHDLEVSPPQVQTQPSAVLDQVFAQMATDMDDFGELSE